MFTAKNYSQNPNLSQSAVDFSSLSESVDALLSPLSYRLTVAVPNFYVDLKAQSLMRSEELSFEEAPNVGCVNPT